MIRMDRLILSSSGLTVLCRGSIIFMCGLPGHAGAPYMWAHTHVHPYTSFGNTLVDHMPLQLRTRTECPPQDSLLGLQVRNPGPDHQ
jgi:hypothetical protein